MPTRGRDPRFELWARRLLVAICAIVALIGLGFVGAAFLPRWWAHLIGDQVNGSIVAGVALGLFYGFLFSALPLAMLRFAVAKRRPLKSWAIMLGIAVLLALPNLLTLGIVVGSGNAAHAGRRTLDVDAPAFRGASLAVVILAVIAFGLLVYLVSARSRARRELSRLRAQQRKPS
jgi:hypothetical protein